MGFGAFLVFAFIVLAIAWLAVWCIGQFLPGSPALIVTLIWGIAVLIILVTLAQAMGLMGHDVMIPRLRS